MNEVSILLVEDEPSIARGIVYNLEEDRITSYNVCYTKLLRRP